MKMRKGRRIPESKGSEVVDREWPLSRNSFLPSSFRLRKCSASERETSASSQWVERRESGPSRTLVRSGRSRQKGKMFSFFMYFFFFFDFYVFLFLFRFLCISFSFSIFIWFLFGFWFSKNANANQCRSCRGQRQFEDANERRKSSSLPM